MLVNLAEFSGEGMAGRLSNVCVSANDALLQFTADIRADYHHFCEWQLDPPCPYNRWEEVPAAWWRAQGLADDSDLDSNGNIMSPPPFVHDEMCSCSYCDD